MKRQGLATMMFGFFFAISGTFAVAGEDASKLCLGARSSSQVVLGDGLAAGSGLDTEALLSILERGGVQYTQTGCTAYYTCPSGQQISCMGANTCGVTTVSCSSRGSTCPDQGGSVGAVVCNGSVQQSCPCPEVCFGCGSPCTTSANCTKCSCGSGFCSQGQCVCPY